MSCSICSKTFGPHRKPTCPSCGIATLYQQRFTYASTLIQTECLRSSVRRVIQHPSNLSDLPTDSSTTDLIESAKQVESRDQQAQIELIDARVARIHEQQASLRAQIAQARADNVTRRNSQAEQRHAIRKDREDLKHLVDSGSTWITLNTECARLQTKMDKIRERTMLGRLKLCRETASLVGLGTRNRRSKDGQIKEEVVIGGLAIPDLRDINTARPDQISASLASVCRLVTVACFYLSVKLPAEIVTPRPGHPHPTILSLQSSYQAQDAVQVPKMSSSSLLLRRTSMTRLQSGRSAHPKHRLLSIAKSLPRLNREDLSTYNLFVEGITLLAWDIAWLCRSQGMPGLDNWEDVCAMGRNLHRLFVDSPFVAESMHRFGEYSHAPTWHKSLAGPDGLERMSRTWDLPPLATVSDKIKSYLLTEMSGAEWELLDEKEWTQEREDERAVLVGGSSRAPTTATPGTVEKGQSDRSPNRMAQGQAEAERVARGEKGWMKLKSRSNES